MEVMKLFQSLWLKLLCYAFLVGGIPMIIAWWKDVKQDWNRKKRRKRRNAKISNHETQRTR